MQAFIARQFAKSKAVPNTFIGGIAKTGGTGVNAPIDTPYKLSQKLGIAVNRITGFKVIEDDVECRIRGGYYLKDQAFGASTSVNSNKNITNFYDEDDLIHTIGGYAFSFTNLTDFKIEGATFIRYACFDGSKITSANLPLVTNSENLTFRNCKQLTTLNIPLITIGRNTMIYGCDNIDFSITAPLITTVQPYFFADLNSNFLENQLSNFPNIHTIQGRSFNQITGPKEINMPSLTTATDNYPFYFVMDVKSYVLNNLVTVSPGETGLFAKGNRACELIEMKKCKILPTKLVEEDSSLDAVPHPSILKLKLHIDTEFSDAVISLKSFYTWAVIEFYDDGGDYVKTI